MRTNRVHAFPFPGKSSVWGTKPIPWFATGRTGAKLLGCISRSFANLFPNHLGCTFGFVRDAPASRIGARAGDVSGVTPGKSRRSGRRRALGLYGRRFGMGNHPPGALDATRSNPRPSSRAPRSGSTCGRCPGILNDPGHRTSPGIEKMTETAPVQQLASQATPLHAQKACGPSCWRPTSSLPSPRRGPRSQDVEGQASSDLSRCRSPPA